MSRRRSKRGAALLEFALAWPVALMLALGCVELAVWGEESFAARSAALAGARAATAAGSSAQVATFVTMRVLAPNLVGARPAEWCPSQAGSAPPVWVCSADLGSAVQVDVGGWVPGVVQIGMRQGLSLRAHVVIEKERFNP
ncbi:MAG: TadE/TadG family type IV pilus assembly protein [Candidatus Dormibacteraceae bacterium]